MSGTLSQSKSTWTDYYETYRQAPAKAPYDYVVSALRRYAPEGGNVYEIGAGSGANLIWAAHNGYQAYGCDIAMAGSFHVQGDFLEQEPPPGFFDFVIDRSCLTYLDETSRWAALSRVYTMLKPGGHVLFTPYGSGSYAHAFDGQPEPFKLTYTEVRDHFREKARWEVTEWALHQWYDLLHETDGIVQHRIIAKKLA